MRTYFDTQVAIARAVNDRVDSLWFDRAREGWKSESTRLPDDKFDDFIIQNSHHEHLAKLAAENKDSRGFEPFFFSTPLPQRYLTPNMDSFDDEYIEHLRGGRYALVNEHDAPREIEEDIRLGVAAGSLSPLFNYQVFYLPMKLTGTPSLIVQMNVLPDTPVGVFREYGGAYSPRLIETVARLRKRLTAYNHREKVNGERSPYTSEIDTRVSTDLPGLGD